ncbi:MAG: hypothetical protein K0S80_2945 [Neobacillus sp.]|nr:hypothetical protein [Neobacillus sp.]
MIKLEIDQEFINQLSNQITKQVVKELSAKYAVASQWPAMLDYHDIMKFFRCSQPTASRIMNIQGFPRVRNVGKKCVPIWSLIDWVDDQSQFRPYYRGNRLVPSP